MKTITECTDEIMVATNAPRLLRAEVYGILSDLVDERCSDGADARALADWVLRTAWAKSPIAAVARRYLDAVQP